MDQRPKELDSLERVARGRVAIGICEAGKLLGLGRDASYKAADAGVLPVLQVGRRRLVLVALFRRLIQGEKPEEVTADRHVERNPWDAMPGDEDH
jgi:hypothetical protein